MAWASIARPLIEAEVELLEAKEVGVEIGPEATEAKVGPPVETGTFNG